MPVIRGVTIFDPDDPSPPQSIYESVSLTPTQLARMRSKIKAELEKMGAPRNVTNFARATSWTMKVFAYGIDLTSDFVPFPSYGTTFLDFSGFIDRKEKEAKAAEIDAEAEAVVEDEEGTRAG